MDRTEDAARRYADAVRAAEQFGVSAEPEAQLTTPVKDLFESVMPRTSGAILLLREAQLDGIRPDFAALHNGRPCGWVELKAPGKPVDGGKWRGREARQWKLLADLDSLILCNGEQVQLYRSGEPVGKPVDLPLKPHGWDPTHLQQILTLFTQSRPSTIRRVGDLALKLAPMTRLLRDRIIDLLKQPGDTAIRRGLKAWSTHVHNGVDDHGFANDLAQVVAYGMAIAALRGGADLDQDSLISLTEARQTLVHTSPVISAALGPVLGVKGLLAGIRHEVAAIERLVSAVDPKAIGKSKDSRGEPWLWFYEDFLREFDPSARQKAGVYYTPTAIVQAQTRLVEHVLRNRFGRELGFAEHGVVTLDPACGSGTYPLAIIDAAIARAARERGPAGPEQVAGTLARNLIAFELMPGPYAVSHLRIGQRIAEASGSLIPPGVRVYLTDTLDDPESTPDMLNLWGDIDVLAEERRRAQAIKRDEAVMVVIGNPPYGRVSQSSGAGGWILTGTGGRALFDDILRPVNTIFSHMNSLYNLYTFFWRWAIWKVFESAGDCPGIVSFITASSWLSGPGFVGLRQLAQRHGDEIWVCDLGGDSRGGDTEENVFDIKIPVAIVTVIRDKESLHKTPAKTYYRRLSGSRQEKLALLDSVEPPSVDPASWEQLPVDNFGAPLAKTHEDTAWLAMPALVDLFPWQMAGMYANRTWPISPSKNILEARWRALLQRTTANERAEAFVTPPTGRNIHTKVRGLPPLSTLGSDAALRRIEPYAFRSFDRQWVIFDPRLIALERPALWASLSDRQVFLTTMTATPIGEGPTLTAATAVPDRHHFCNRGGKDVVPLYRDRACSHPNVTAGLLGTIGKVIRKMDPRFPDPTPEDLASYVYALLAGTSYQERFINELRKPGPRVPLTADPALFVEARDLGRELLWLHTFGQRFNDSNRPRKIPRHPNIAWIAAVKGIPGSPQEISFDPESKQLFVGTGIVAGVRQDVWEFEVTGWKVLQKWLGYRTGTGAGRASTQAKPLDLIRPSQWEDEWNVELLELLTVLTRTVESEPVRARVLAQICASRLIEADQLPVPSAAERKEPKV